MNFKNPVNTIAIFTTDPINQRNADSHDANTDCGAFKSLIQNIMDKKNAKLRPNYRTKIRPHLS